MRPDIINTAILATAFLAVFGMAEIMYHYLKIAAEHTRKFVHIVSGLITSLFPVMLGNQWLVLFLCASFALILIGSILFHFLPSINAVGRHTVGSLIYPAAVYGCYLVYNHENEYIYFYLPILILSISDPIAAIIGKRLGKRKFTIGSEQKSFAGSFAFFISAFIISVALLFLLTNLSSGIVLVYSLIIGFSGAATEGLSRKGIDNVTVPAVVIIIMKFICNL